MIAEIHRVLRPGGRISIHGLIADRPFPGKPNLPGPAAMVQYIPVETESHDELKQAGFIALAFEKLGDIHCFRADGLELREMRLTAMKPLTSDSTASHYVMFRGPLAEVSDEQGRQYPRGTRVCVDQAQWNLFRQPAFAEHFTCFRCVEAK